MISDRKNEEVHVEGPQTLHGADLEGRDIRMTATLSMGALIADGRSEVSGLYHLYRGYDDFVEKLQSLGADVQIIADKEA